MLAQSAGQRVARGIACPGWMSIFEVSVNNIAMSDKRRNDTQVYKTICVASIASLLHVEKVPVVHK